MVYTTAWVPLYGRNTKSGTSYLAFKLHAKLNLCLIPCFAFLSKLRLEVFFDYSIKFQVKESCKVCEIYHKLFLFNDRSFIGMDGRTLTDGE